MLSTQAYTFGRGVCAAANSYRGLLRSQFATEQGELDEIIEANLVGKSEHVLLVHCLGICCDC